ncbi:hypothetical protein ACK3ZV_05745 [Aeromonas caviae]
MQFIGVRKNAKAILAKNITSLDANNVHGRQVTVKDAEIRTGLTAFTAAGLADVVNRGFLL